MQDFMCPFSWAAMRALTLFCPETTLPANLAAWQNSRNNDLAQTTNKESGKESGKESDWCQALVEQLHLQTDDHVLEIGFGRGESLGHLLAATAQGSVTGVESSLELVTLAARHYQFSIKAGHLELEQAEAHALPFEYGRFSKALVATAYATWENPEYCLNELHRVLRKGGQLVIGLPLKSSDRRQPNTTGFKYEEAQEIAGLVRWVGFGEVELTHSAKGFGLVSGQR